MCKHWKTNEPNPLLILFFVPSKIHQFKLVNANKDSAYVIRSGDIIILLIILVFPVEIGTSFYIFDLFLCPLSLNS